MGLPAKGEKGDSGRETQKNSSLRKWKNRAKQEDYCVQNTIREAVQKKLSKTV